MRMKFYFDGKFLPTNHVKEEYEYVLENLKDDHSFNEKFITSIATLDILGVMNINDSIEKLIKLKEEQ